MNNNAMNNTMCNRMNYKMNYPMNTPRPFSEAMDMINSIYGKNKALEAENERLKIELGESKKREIDLSNLNESEIQTVLSGKKIVPRLLFEAIQRMDNSYDFYCKDRVSGTMTPIKTEYSAKHFNL